MGLDCKGYCETKNQEHGTATAIVANPQIVELLAASPFWQLPEHNYLRITRMLNSLSQTGHRACSKRIYNTMIAILNRTHQHPISDATLAFWQRTQQPFQEQN